MERIRSYPPGHLFFIAADTRNDNVNGFEIDVMLAKLKFTRAIQLRAQTSTCLCVGDRRHFGA